MTTPNTISLEELAERLGGELAAEGSQAIHGVAPLEAATAHEVSFLANPRYVQHMADSNAAAVIVATDYEGPGERLLRCRDPYRAFRDAMVLFYGFREHPFEGIDETARIAPTATLGRNVRVGPYVVVAPHANIGDGCVLYPGVFVGPHCRLGADCVLYSNVTLYDRTVLGDRVTVHASASLGVDGFGYATHPDEKGVVFHDKIPPNGWVEVEDDVEIGSGCAVQRAAMGPTVVGAGSKFADLVAIGHGTHVGKHCLMVSQSGIAGSTQVGDYCSFGGQAGVVGHIRIGNVVRVGAQAGVTGDIPDHTEVFGAPAIPRDQAGKAYTLIARLPEMRSQLRNLTRQVEKLHAEIDALEHGDRPS